MAAKEADPLMTAVVSAVKDLLKFRIIQNIATGDKTYDSLLQTFFLSIMSAVFGWFSLEYFRTKYRIWVFGKGKKITTSAGMDPENYRNWTEISVLRMESLIYKTWRLNGSDGCEEFTQKFCTYFIEKVGWKLNKDAIILFDPMTLEEDGTVNSTELFKTIRQVVSKEKYMPMFVLGEHIAGCCCPSDTVLSFYSDDNKTLTAMLKEIKDAGIDHARVEREKENSKGCDNRVRVYKKEDQEFKLYNDRCLDKFVSRHKPRIKNLLDGFIKANLKDSNGSDYGGFGTYNLGMILHGKPGTGKTMLIKAVCNYLKRDACIVDMRKIRNKADFEYIFYGDHSIKNHVFVLDEFDCVQDAIRDRSLDSKDGNDPKSTGDLLHQKKIELLKLLMHERSIEGKIEKKESKPEGNCDNTKKDSKADVVFLSPIQKELNRINKQIDDHENALSLDTILTVLDGAIEMRGRVIIATTNFLNNIDPALLRDGRFDMKINLDAFNSDEIRELLTLMFKDKASKEEMEMLNTIKLKEDQYTPTQLINLAVSHGSLTKVLEVIKHKDT